MFCAVLFTRIRLFAPDACNVLASRRKGTGLMVRRTPPAANTRGVKQGRKGDGHLPHDAGPQEIVGARAPRKCLGGGPSSSSASSTSSGGSPSGKKYSGGNPVCPRPTPEWQKGIDSFFTKQPANMEDEVVEEEAESEITKEETGCSRTSSGSSQLDGDDRPCASGSSSEAGSHKRSADCAGPSRTQDSTDDES